MESWVIWLIAYASTVTLLSALTVLFLIIRRTRFKQLANLEFESLVKSANAARAQGDNKLAPKVAPPVISAFGSALEIGTVNEELVRARLSFVVPDKNDEEDEKMFSQTGMSRSYLGGFVKWSWRLLFVLSNIIMLLFCMDEYYWIKFDWQSEAGHFNWTDAGKPMLLIFFTTHAIMLFFSLFNSDMLFMLPAPLATCSHVLVSEEDPDVVSDESQSEIGAALRVDRRWWQRFVAWATQYKQQFKRRLRWKLEAVQIVDCEQGLVRWFYHTSIWYKWSNSRGFFHVTRFEVPLPVHIHKQFEIGGLDEDEAERAEELRSEQAFLAAMQASASQPSASASAPGS